MDMKKILLILITLIIMTSFTIAFTSQQYIKKFISIKAEYAFLTTQNITLREGWNIIYLSHDPDMDTYVKPLNSRTLELSVTKKKSGKWASAICNFEGSKKEISLEEFENNKWQNSGKLKFGKLKNYNLPEWCDEGFVVFSPGLKDRKFRLIFNEGYKKFRILIGKGTEEILAEYNTGIKEIGNVVLIDFNLNNQPVKMITTKSQVGI
jgi:hypothetical protein